MDNNDLVAYTGSPAAEVCLIKKPLVYSQDLINYARKYTISVHASFKADKVAEAADIVAEEKHNSRSITVYLMMQKYWLNNTYTIV